MNQERHKRKVVAWSQRVDRHLRRGFEIVFSLACLIVFSPILLTVPLMIRLVTGESGYFIQSRKGAHGKDFRIVKIRTVYTGESAYQRPLLSFMSSTLRRYYIDEIPQFWLVIQGKMRLVGPRPITPNENKTIRTKISKWDERYVVTPGMTGLAQVRGYDTETPGMMIEKDLTYISNRSLLFDLRIVFTQLFCLVKKLLSRLST